ncbi:helix-turn-helix domain-containing protein [Pseudoxanthomonas winnipegensis]|uniref:helix-turn-helix domain-containing protein n=1 Tax=Pseudoxanthomonas winnipegensis TaxID=2480810 RepID=UPI001040C80E|nr:helix-turn-helix domain-containing protein [Pseudoxanthomonas winnipegensis]TBV76838.1 transcriptional regulator [Pseudoxanthomonas winnipegensis]
MPNATSQKNPAPKDWHRADVKAALDKAGWSLRQLGIHYGYSQKSSPLGEVFRKPWPKVERIIAAAIGVKPQDIWPSRYDTKGNPNRRMGRAPKRPAHIKPDQGSTGVDSGNPQKAVR